MRERRSRARELGDPIHESELCPAGKDAVADGGVPSDSGPGPVSHRVLVGAALELLVPGDAFGVLGLGGVRLHRQPVFELTVWTATDLDPGQGQWWLGLTKRPAEHVLE